jgi:hypothetical protein
VDFVDEAAHGNEFFRLSQVRLVAGISIEDLIFLGRLFGRIRFGLVAFSRSYRFPQGICRRRYNPCALMEAG